MRFVSRLGARGAQSSIPPLMGSKTRWSDRVKIPRALGAAALAVLLLTVAGCADMEFSQKKYKFAENEKKTIGFFIINPGKYKIDEILTEGDVNNRFTLEKEACKDWKGEVAKKGESVGCLFTIESKGLLAGEEVTLTGKYEREPAVVETPSSATLEHS